ncbi:hypothetical protein E2C01_089527 [Portunus trituberculatus]|uniref:Uncharacterized protein n=1 Tax=Portunus trituberculatus TaxID=210409 RepID=A0A5B7JC94_PORTR|nr:hypothetical protein [Portunus trituberculatus]
MTDKSVRDSSAPRQPQCTATLASWQQHPRKTLNITKHYAYRTICSTTPMEIMQVPCKLQCVSLVDPGRWAARWVSLPTQPQVSRVFMNHLDLPLQTSTNNNDLLTYHSTIPHPAPHTS